jgi:hypothetical protein
MNRSPVTAASPEMSNSDVCILHGVLDVCHVELPQVARCDCQVVLTTKPPGFRLQG